MPKYRPAKANPLKDAHAALDTTVPHRAKKDLLVQLLALNQEVAAKIEKGEPVTAPGVPKNYPDAKKLVTEDCIQPAKTMTEERHERLTIEEIKERLRTGYQFYPTQPGLKETARELIRPLVEGIAGREIVYVCRVPKLMRVEKLKTDANGFRARAITLHDLGCRIPSLAERVVLERTFNGRRPTKEEWQAAVNALPVDPKPLDFGAAWTFLRLRGSAIRMNMLTDCFYPDPVVVAAVKAAVAQGNVGEVSAILRHAAGEE